MASRHIYRDSTQLAWYDNRDQIKLDIRKIVRRLENEVLDEAAREFDAALGRGELLELRPGESSLAALVSKQAQRIALEIGTDE